ncbi:MAG TPA: hypothetical protein VI911_08640 [Patescibacteria group bacterium]|nr:MAG: hypothetical protein UR43_C0005G0105 [candidate division TM6 bacterium GW2011_GWF2_33_332]HLD91063.1 hypothetical protein [Patescibacteria group bacterium]
MKTTKEIKNLELKKEKLNGYNIFYNGFILKYKIGYKQNLV